MMSHQNETKFVCRYLKCVYNLRYSQVTEYLAGGDMSIRKTFDFKDGNFFVDK